MTTTYNGLLHLNGNVMAAVDVETTGDRPGYHEIVQIAVVPLNSDLRPLKGVRPFYQHIAPLYPERADMAACRVHGIDLNYLIQNAPGPDKIADLLMDWFLALDLPSDKKLVPLAHNWAFESGFLTAWLGTAAKLTIFHFHPRDAMSFALSLNDRRVFAGDPAYFSRVSLSHLSHHFSVTNERPHDALHDCLAEAEVYRHMLRIA